MIFEALIKCIEMFGYIAQVIQKAVKALVRESNTVCNWLTFLNLQN